MKPPTNLTEHAINRFIERHVPRMSFEDARGVLETIRATAQHVEDLPDEGQEIWRGCDAFSSVLMVVRDGWVRTVLPPGSERPKGRRR